MLFFTCLCGYHVMITLMQRELLLRTPRICEQRLALTTSHWRYRIKWIWIIALLAIAVVNETTRFVDGGLWESLTGPLCQWAAILGTILVSSVHSLDVRHFVQSSHRQELTPIPPPGEREGEGGQPALLSPQQVLMESTPTETVNTRGGEVVDNTCSPMTSLIV